MSARHLLSLGCGAYIALSANLGRAQEESDHIARVDPIDALSLTPAAGLVVPLGIGTAGFDDKLGVGWHAGAMVGHRNQDKPIAITVGGDYSSYHPIAVHVLGSDGRVRANTPYVVDLLLGLRYWMGHDWLYVDALFGVGFTSLVRIRNLDVPAHADIDGEVGATLGTGFGVGLIPFTSRGRRRDAAMLLLGTDLRVRVMPSGSVVTLPITLGINL